MGVSGEENEPFEALQDVRQHTIPGLNVRTNAIQATVPGYHFFTWKFYSRSVIVNVLFPSQVVSYSGTDST